MRLGNVAFPATMPAADVDQDTFEQDVIERSRERPVVVDFWAAWCGPCRQLGPVLERVADAHAGEVELVKVDVDRNQQLAQRFGVQGIPAVKAFRDGKVVDEFVGAYPPAAVERFVAGLLPSEADRLVEAGDEESLRLAIEAAPGRADARLALARMLLGRGEEADAEALLRPVEHDREAAGILARLELARDPSAPPEASAALAALAGGDHGVALAQLLEAAVSSDGDLRDLIRRVMIGIFGELGDTDPLSVSYRRRLASALY